jgi:hypothetical protein
MLDMLHWPSFGTKSTRMVHTLFRKASTCVAVNKDLFDHPLHTSIRWGYPLASYFHVFIVDASGCLLESTGRI